MRQIIGNPTPSKKQAPPGTQIDQMISPVPRTNLHPLYGLRSSDGVCKHWGELKRYSQLAEKGSEERIRVEFRVIVEDEVRADYRAAYTFLYARGSSFCLLLSLSLSLSLSLYPASREITTTRCVPCASTEAEGRRGSGRKESKVKLHQQTTRLGVLRVLLIARHKM